MPDHPLRPLTTLWSEKIKLAWDYKKTEFQDQADLAMAFFDGPYDWLYNVGSSGKLRHFSYQGGAEDMPRPTFCMTVNKVAELVGIFGPALYHRNPVRQVNPRKPPELPPEFFGSQQNPQAMLAEQQQTALDQARASLLQTYLNYTPNALDLKTESRWAIDEALIKGMGLLWTETYQPPGADRLMAGSFYDSVDHLVVDPDMESLRDAKWVARRCIHPYWEVERTYQLPEGALSNRASLESIGRQADMDSSDAGNYNRKAGKSNDLVVYWKIWSKMGLGGLLSGMNPDLRKSLDGAGPYCHLVVCDQLPYPLNLPPELLDKIGQGNAQAADEAWRRVQWPTPFWSDDGWPFTPIIFHPIPRKVWPQSHVSPGMGELIFLNWAYSFLAGKVKNASRDFIAVAKSTSEEVKRAITQGPDYTLIEVEMLHNSIDNMVKFLQHPEFNPDIYKVIEGVAESFDKRVGLTELMYGLSSSQLRSATEADVKSDQLSVRPDDLANKVEEAMAMLAVREAFCARWHLTGKDVSGVLGPTGAYWWDQLLVPSNPADIVHGLEYRIEAGSARKPNKARDAQNMQSAMQNLFMPLMQYGQATGDVAPVNALIGAWAKSIDLEAGAFLLRPPPPPMPMPAGTAAPPSEGAAA